jgi:hypothetical protein
VWCFGLFWALVLHCFPGCSSAGVVQRLCCLEFLHLRFCPPSNAIMHPSLQVASYLSAPTGSAGQGLCPIVLGLCPIVTWLRHASVRSCRGFIRSSLGSARSLSDRVGSLSDRHLAQPDLCPIVLDLCPIVIWLSLVFVRSCWISIRSSFCSASFFVWCVTGLIYSVICYSGQVLSLISNMVFLAPFQVSGAVPSTVPRADS